MFDRDYSIAKVRLLYSGSRFPRSGPASQQAVCESYKRLRILDELAAADGRIGLDIGREAASEISFFFGAAVTLTNRPPPLFRPCSFSDIFPVDSSATSPERLE